LALAALELKLFGAYDSYPKEATCKGVWGKNATGQAWINQRDSQTARTAKQLSRLQAGIKPPLGLACYSRSLFIS